MKTQTSKTRIWLSIALLLPIIAILFYIFAEKEFVEKENTEIVDAIKSELEKANDLQSIYKDEANLFLVTVEKNGNSIELKCESGCKWSHLVLEPNSEGHIINDYGFSEGKTIDTDRFAFSIKPNNNGIELGGLKGTAWVDLAFSLQKNRKQAINQMGMTNTPLVQLEEINNDLQKRAEENHYTKQFFSIKDKNGQYVKKRFYDLSYEDKIKWVHTEPIPYTRIDVTQAHFENAKNSKDYIIKVNGNYISKKELDTYKASDFITFRYTPISELAKMKEQSVLNLVTHNAYNMYCSLMIKQYQDVINDFEKEIKLPENERQKDIKEIVSTYEFLYYNYKQFTQELIKKHNFKPPTPISDDIIKNVNQSYLDIPILLIDENENLFLNNTLTTLKTIEEDFNKLTKFQKSELILEADGRQIHKNFVDKIMIALGDNLINIQVANAQVLIYDPIYKSKGSVQQKLPTKKEVATYNAWAKKIHSKSKKLSSDATWHPPIDEQKFIKFTEIYNRMSQRQKNQAVEYPFPGLEAKASEQQGATKKQIREYNAWAKKINTAIKKANTNKSYAYPIIKQKDAERYIHIYKNLMTNEQRKNAEPLPSIPPPPPPKPVAIEIIEQEREIPAPPIPENASPEEIKRMKKVLSDYKKKHPESVTRTTQNDEIIEIVEIPMDQEGKTKIAGNEYFYKIKDGVTTYYDRHGNKVDINKIPPPPPPTKAAQYKNGKKKTLNEIINETPKSVKSGYELLENGESHYYTVYKGKKTYYNKDGFITDKKGNVLPPPPPPPPAPKKQQLKEKTVKGYPSAIKSSQQNLKTIKPIEIDINKDNSLVLNGKPIEFKNLVSAVEKLNQHFTIEQRRNFVEASIRLEKNKSLDFAKKVQKELRKVDIYQVSMSYNQNIEKSGLSSKHISFNSGLTIAEAKAQREKFTKEYEETALNTSETSPWQISVSTEPAEFFEVRENSSIQNPEEITIDFIVKMAKADAKFFYELKPITSDKAIELVKKNPKLNVLAKKTNTKEPLVYISKKQ